MKGVTCTKYNLYILSSVSGYMLISFNHFICAITFRTLHKEAKLNSSMMKEMERNISVLYIIQMTILLNLRLRRNFVLKGTTCYSGLRFTISFSSIIKNEGKQQFIYKNNNLTTEFSIGFLDTIATFSRTFDESVQETASHTAFRV